MTHRQETQFYHKSYQVLIRNLLFVIGRLQYHLQSFPQPNHRGQKKGFEDPEVSLFQSLQAIKEAPLLFLYEQFQQF